MPFATAGDLATFMERTLDAGKAALALDMAADAIRADLEGQTLDMATSTDEVYDGTGSYLLLLRETPVLDVVSVIEDDVTLTYKTGFTWSDNGQLWRFGRWWTPLQRGVKVTYEHGYAPSSWQFKVLRTVNIQAAARAYINPSQAASQTVGGISMAFPRSLGGDAGTGRVELTTFEKRLLDPLRTSYEA